MPYEPKTWTNRVTEHPSRRRLTDTGITDVYDISREEGTITAEGDKINALNMNSLESRVNNAFISMGVDAYACIKTGTVYDLKNSNSPFNGTFLAPADYVAGDTFRVNPTDQLFNSATAIAGFINNTDGTLNTSAVGNYSSPLIIISPSTDYKIVGHTYTQPAASVGVAWYDSSGAYISGVNYGGATGNGTYTSPATAYYVRYTINTIDLSVSIFELNSSTNTDTTYTSSYTVVTSGGEALRSGAFLANDIVSIKLDITNTKLYIRQDNAPQVGAIPVNLGGITDCHAALTPGDYSIGGPTLNAPYTPIWGNLEVRTLDGKPYDGSDGFIALRITDSAGTVYEQSALNGGAYTSWHKPIASTADYASGLNPETAPCLVNTLVLPYRTSTVPTGLPDNTFVFWRDVAAP